MEDKAGKIELKFYPNCDLLNGLYIYAAIDIL